MMTKLLLLSVMLCALAQAELTGYNLRPDEVSCPKGTGGKGCSCDSLNTDPMQGAKASTIVLGGEQTRVEDGMLYLQIEQSPMLVKTKMTLGLDNDEDNSDLCSELFDWTLSTLDCSNNTFVGMAIFADVLEKCNPEIKETEDSGDNAIGGKDEMTELTFHFNVNNERDVKIADVWKKQVTTTYMPVRVSLQKTFAATTTTITVEEILERFLRIELTFEGDPLKGDDNSPPVDDDALIEAFLADFGAALEADTSSNPDDYAKDNVNINKIDKSGAKDDNRQIVVLRILLLDEDTVADSGSGNPKNVKLTQALEDAYVAMTNLKALYLFSSSTKEVITSIIAPSGVMKVATARTSASGSPELDLLLYAQAGYPYVLTVPLGAEGAEYPPHIEPVATGAWAKQTENEDACADDADSCGTYFTLTAKDDGLNAQSFTGVYKVVLNVACKAGIPNDECAVFGRAMTASLLFTVETGNHMPQVLGPVTLDGKLTTTALDYKFTTGGEDTLAQNMNAFLNDETLYTVAEIWSGQAQLTNAEAILVLIKGTEDNGGQVILYNRDNTDSITPQGSGVDFKTYAGTPPIGDATEAGGKLYPRFEFKTNMTVLNLLNGGNGAAGFTVDITIEVSYKGLLEDRRRRLLTTTRRLLAPANEVVVASQGSVALSSAPLAGADPVKKTDGGINAGASVLPGSGVLALLVAMMCVALH